MRTANMTGPLDKQMADPESQNVGMSLVMLRHAFPAALNEDVERVGEVLPCPILDREPNGIGPIFLSGERIKIPDRVYYPEIQYSHRTDLTEIQRCMLSCIYTRHYDGLVREKQIGSLLGIDRLWVQPFIIQLIGEYVIEIVEFIDRNKASLAVPCMSAFIEENPDFMELTTQRAISYWNCYYRGRFPKKENYPGLRLLRHLEQTVKV